MADALLPPGFLWRIQSLRTGHYLRASRSTDVSTSPHFFSLFELRALEDGTHVLREHWTSRPLQVGSPGFGKRLGLTPPPRPKRRYLHWQVNWPPGFPPPPQPPSPPTPVLPTQRFQLRRRSGGGYVLFARARGGKERTGVRQPAQGQWLVVGSASAGGGRDGDSFTFQRVASAASLATTGAEDAVTIARTDASARSSSTITMQVIPSGTNGRLSRSIRQAITRVRGQSMVVATAYDAKGMVDVAQIFWSRLATSGVRGCLLLSSDDTACEALRTLNSTAARRAHCITPHDLQLPARVIDRAWRRDDVPDFETDANTVEARFLRRCKLRMIAAILQKGHAAVFVDVDVLVLSRRYLQVLASTSTADLAIAGDPQTGFHDENPGRCLRIAPANIQQMAADWVGAGQFFVRATDAGRWLIREAERLMDAHVINDGDALQALLTGHAQVSDPLRAPRQPVRPSATSRVAGWLKPMWLEADNEPFTTTGGSALARSRWIRPLNAPLEPEAWQRLLSERKKRNFTWSLLPERRFLTLQQPERWEPALRAALSINAGPGGAATEGGVVSVKLSCHLIEWLDARRAVAGRLFRP